MTVQSLTPFDRIAPIGKGGTPIISYNYGAHQQTRIAHALKIALFTAVLCGIVVTSGLCIGVKPIVVAFLSPSEPEYDIAVHGLPLFATCAIFFAVNITFIGYYQSIESAWRSIFYTFMRGILFIIPAFLLLPSIFGNYGPWLAIPVAEALSLMVIICSYFLIKSKQKHRHTYQ